MELTKQDKKHIEEQVKKINLRIVDEAKEYATLYERYYYERLIAELQDKISTIDEYREQIKKVYNK